MKHVGKDTRLVEPCAPSAAQVVLRRQNLRQGPAPGRSLSHWHSIAPGCWKLSEGNRFETATETPERTQAAMFKYSLHYAFVWTLCAMPACGSSDPADGDTYGVGATSGGDPATSSAATATSTTTASPGNVGTTGTTGTTGGNNTGTTGTAGNTTTRGMTSVGMASTGVTNGTTSMGTTTGSATTGGVGTTGTGIDPEPTDYDLDCGDNAIVLEAHGPPDNRINYIIVGDGYTSA